MLGCRGSAISRDKLVRELDTKASGPALAAAQLKLRNIFGLELASAKMFEDVKQTKTEKLFIYGGIHKTKVQQMLSRGESNTSAAKKAFTWLIFQNIWTSAGRRIRLRQLLANLQEVDPRVPEEVSLRAKASSNPEIPQLGQSVGQLIAELVSEGYIVCTPDAVDKDPMKTAVSFGQRFFLEVGHQQLVQGFFEGAGLPVDRDLMREIQQEYQRAEAEGGVDEANGTQTQEDDDKK